MDAVRFGRALGFGARQAAKTLVTAVDAATAEDPQKQSVARASTSTVVVEQSERKESLTQAQPQTSPTVMKAARTMAQTVTKGQETKQALKRGRKRFGQAAMEPVVRLSGVLGLEMAGVFFGLFALGGVSAAWRLRGNWRMSGPGHTQFLGALGMILVFGYFCVSSFVRAKRRERRR